MYCTRGSSGAMRFKRLEVGASRVPCANPIAMIHMALVELGEDEGLEIITKKSNAREVREALAMLDDVVQIVEESLEGDVYKVRVVPRHEQKRG
ncbi:hypothetical protein Pyrfu_0395 [Pyrolobus fumarii 1A]|uniref:Uncharacterized protein n=2 Tax=Pyrolobus fumarii TaxID=54252 RepID=G0EG19_PYRF1|nr:hypothetical protein Pyrfu_0395 [Pyrolobus fumarii 1A]